MAEGDSNENIQEQEKNMTSTSYKEDLVEDNYGIMPLIQSKEKLDRQLLSIRDINETLIKQTIWICGRLHSTRRRGKQCFITIRHQSATIQAVVCVNENISNSMVKFISNITKESIIDVEGEVTLPPVSVESCTQKNIELQVRKVFVVSSADGRLPLLVENVMRSNISDREVFNVSQDVRLENRAIDLRKSANQAIFRMEAGVCKLFRDILDAKGFIEIHTPKITSAPSEELANVFQVTYFKSNACLAQSPQFYKQMAIAGDFEKVYTIGAVFRVDHATTRLHLTEFVGLDLEMTFNYHYHEVLEIIGDLFIQIFKSLTERFGTEIEIINQQFPCEPFQYLDPPLCLEYKDGIALLAEAGIQMNIEDGLSFVYQRHLGQIVKAKYHTDFYILDKYPLVVRPFYTMPDAENPIFSNSYEMFMRGEEILSGAQSIHDVQLLLERIKSHNINADQIKFYTDTFRYGCSPHAGCGIGLERVIMLYLNLNNIRNASMFPRDSRRLTP